MGNVEGAVVRNVDKRTSRREHRETFISAVARFRDAPFEPPLHPPGASAGASTHQIRVCVRKRPIFPHETVQGEFDAITCLAGRVVVHDARMQSDMITMFMNHYDFAFDGSFSESADNGSVYNGTACELVHRTIKGGNATVVMYGQTGSGKTHTMSGIYERAADELFNIGDTQRRITVSFIELFGDAAHDVLNQGASVSLATASDGSVQPYPCVEVAVKNAGELSALIDMAGKLRATAATCVNNQSSRSHALCRIFVLGENDHESCLTLVDLAGSEHRIDSMEHNPERRKEGAKINQSLWALKECIRAVASGSKSGNFRQHKLTHLLQGCFDGRARHPTVIIATISPCSKDTEHTLNTLRHACIMDGQGEFKAGGGEHIASGAVTKEKLGEIDVTRIARERRAEKKKKLAEGVELVDEAQIQANSLSAVPEPSPPVSGADRGALDRRCVNALPRGLRQALLEVRAMNGTSQQHKRMGRAPTQGATAVTSVVPCKRRTRAVSCPPAASEEGENQTDVGHINSHLEAALNLFSLFCIDGRSAKTWLSNDLRLINTHVVPVLFGFASQISWQQPSVALDQLEFLISRAPPPSHFLQKKGNSQIATKGDSCKLPPLDAQQSYPADSARDGYPPTDVRRSSRPRAPVSDSIDKKDQQVFNEATPTQRSRSREGANRPPLLPAVAKPRNAPIDHQDDVLGDAGPTRRVCSSSPRSNGAVNRSVSARRRKTEAARKQALEDSSLKSREKECLRLGEPMAKQAPPELPSLLEDMAVHALPPPEAPVLAAEQKLSRIEIESERPDLSADDHQSFVRCGRFKIKDPLCHDLSGQDRSAS